MYVCMYVCMYIYIYIYVKYEATKRSIEVIHDKGAIMASACQSSTIRAVHIRLPRSESRQE